MAAPASALTFWDALAALAPLIGAGGISGIIIAVLGYLRGAREGRSPTLDTGGQVGIATLYADRAAIEQAGQAINDLVDEVRHLRSTISDVDGGAKIEKLVDEIRELRRAVEDVADRVGRH